LLNGQKVQTSHLLTKSFTKTGKQWPGATTKCEEDLPKAKARIQVFYRLCYVYLKKKKFLTVGQCVPLTLLPSKTCLSFAVHTVQCACVPTNPQHISVRSEEMTRHFNQLEMFPRNNHVR